MPDAFDAYQALDRYERYFHARLSGIELPTNLPPEVVQSFTDSLDAADLSNGWSSHERRHDAVRLLTSVILSMRGVSS